jgi:hypothetical protein
MATKSEAHRAKAKELRASAARIRDRFLKDAILNLAAQYETLANDIDRTPGAAAANNEAGD